MPAPLDELSARLGIATSYEAINGETIEVPDTTKIRILKALGVEANSNEHLTAGLRTWAGQDPPRMERPKDRACFVPDWLAASRAWGIALQLYELRSERNWGIGDFADLAAFCRTTAALGAEFVGTNPLHALFTADPERCSPFSPSNRQFLNPLYIAPDRLPGYVQVVSEKRIQALRETELVDYGGVRDAKFVALRATWSAWLRSPAAGLDKPAFDQFRRERGKGLQRHAVFEALSWHFSRAGAGAGWRTWPSAYQDPDSAEVRGFEAKFAEDVSFHAWLQWVAELQLAETAAAARKAGMRIGLYLDFAVGEAPDGSAAWSARDVVVPGVSIGAPPDFFSADGQDWGLAPLSPRGLQETGYARYREIVEALMRHGGALRIDHAMSLWQLFFIPEGSNPSDGSYVRYRIDELLRILADLSQRHQTLVIGEDLGNVPRGFRELMQEAQILSYRIVYFEQSEGEFLAPDAYPRLALACLSTHDLPTLIGWWRGDDIALRHEHGLIGADARDEQVAERARMREALLGAFTDAGVLSPSGAGDLAKAELRSSPDLANLFVAAHRFIARTPSILVAVRLADLAADSRPTNLPGTVDSYPNWRPKASLRIDEFAEHELSRSIIETFAKERPKTT